MRALWPCPSGVFGATSPQVGRTRPPRHKWGGLLSSAGSRTLHLNKGEALSLQYHERKDEYQYLIKGSIDVELGGSDGELTARRMSAGDTLHLTPGTRHRLTAVEDSDIFEVSTPEIDDVVRLEDRYGRV